MKKARSKQNAGRMRRILLSNQFCITVLVVMTLLAIICLAKVILGFLPIKQFTCEGDTKYHVVEIVSASGIQQGDKLYRVDEGEAEQMILKNCPYVKSVEIKTVFPDTLCFVIEEKEPGWYLQFGTEYYSLDYDLELLVLEYDEKNVTGRGMTKLVLPEVEEVIISGDMEEPNVPVFASDDEQLRKETLEIIDKFRTHEIKSRLTMLDLSNRFEISLTIDQKYEVSFGDTANFDVKMKKFMAALAVADDPKYSGGTLTWTDATRDFSFKPTISRPEVDESLENVPQE